MSITTLATVASPFSRPSGSMVPKAVVAGISAFGRRSLAKAIISRDVSRVPGDASLKSVSLCGEIEFKLPQKVVLTDSVPQSLEAGRLWFCLYFQVFSLFALQQMRLLQMKCQQVVLPL